MNIFYDYNKDDKGRVSELFAYIYNYSFYAIVDYDDDCVSLDLFRNLISLRNVNKVAFSDFVSIKHILMGCVSYNRIGDEEIRLWGNPKINPNPMRYLLSDLHNVSDVDFDIYTKIYDSDKTDELKGWLDGDITIKNSVDSIKRAYDNTKPKTNIIAMSGELDL